MTYLVGEVAKTAGSTLFCVGAIVGGGAVVGGFVDQMTGYSVQDGVKTHETQLDDANRIYLEKADGHSDMEIQVGELCLRSLNHYRPGGELANTPQESIISDLKDSDNHGCGQTTTDMRAAINKTLTWDIAKDDAALQVELAKKYLERAKVEKTNDNKLNGAERGAKIFAVSAGILGLVSLVFWAKDHEKRIIY